MTREQFIAETLILLNNKFAVPFKDLKAEDYGISRATAYRALKALKEANIINGDFSLTQHARERLCGNCTYRKRCLKEYQERHRERAKRRHFHI